MTPRELSSLPAGQAREAFLRCCGSRSWVERMLATRPFDSEEGLLAAAERAWKELSREDCLEAFAHHPRIGGDAESLRKKFAATAGWASEEQRGAQGASEATIQALARGNAEYEARFGHVFLICATGKSADEMLAALQRRLGNKPEEELRIAASEQARITALRLKKLLSEGSPS